MAAVLLAGCSPGDDAKATVARGRAKDVCVGLGLKPGGPSDTAPDDSTTTDLAEAAKEGNSLADKAAAAADADPRWTRLADAINTITMIFQGAADQGDATGTTLTDADHIDVKNAARVMHAECRKAFATG